jgi:hypothetical protein
LACIHPFLRLIFLFSLFHRLLRSVVSTLISKFYSKFLLSNLENEDLSSPAPESGPITSERSGEPSPNPEGSTRNTSDDRVECDGSRSASAGLGLPEKERKEVKWK